MTTTGPATTNALRLPGLDGSNPLGFLAALGLLRVVDASTPTDAQPPRMQWVTAGATWVPELFGARDVAGSEEALLEHLQGILAPSLDQHTARHWRTVLEGGHEARRRLATSQEAEVLDWLGGVGIATSPSVERPEDHDTQLRTARRDYHLLALEPILAETTAGHLRRTLFSLWDYADPMEKLSLHLDPADDRRHAYQWNKPSGDPSRSKRGSMLGANRLAIEAFPLLPTLPTARGRATAGFRGRRSTDTFWRWPIWTVPITAALVPPVLNLADLQPGPHDKSDGIGHAAALRLRERGIAAVFESQRILVGKTPNLTPARAVL